MEKHISKAVYTTRYRLALKVRAAQHSDRAHVLVLDQSPISGPDIGDYFSEALHRPDLCSLVVTFGRWLVGYVVVTRAEDQTCLTVTCCKMAPMLSKLKMTEEVDILISNVLKAGFRGTQYMLEISSAVVNKQVQPLHTWYVGTVRYTNKQLHDVIINLQSVTSQLSPLVSGTRMRGEDVSALISDQGACSEIFKSDYICTGNQVHPLKVPVGDATARRRLTHSNSVFYGVWESGYGREMPKSVCSVCTALGSRGNIVCSIYLYDSPDKYLVSLLYTALCDVERSGDGKCPLVLRLWCSGEAVIGRLEKVLSTRETSVTSHTVYHLTRRDVK